MQKRMLFLLALVAIGCTKPKFNPEWTREKSPETFAATFETTKGNFDIEVKRSWSPKAADRFYQLLRHGYYDNAIFYRVVPGFVAQFGNTDVPEMKEWKAVTIPDEALRLKNKKGTISFARSGKDSRDLEIFINLEDNPVLDTLDYEGVKGFPAFGTITKGMETVENLYSGYGETTMGDPNFYVSRDAFYSTYPKLDIIRKAYVANEK